MGFADKYFVRFKVADKFLDDSVDSNLGMIVVIPCYDDFEVFHAIESLQLCCQPNVGVELIVVVNSAENTPLSVVEANRQIFNQLTRMAKSNSYFFKILPIVIENTPKKIAGVGNARKIGIDEAVRRLSAANNPHGLILSLDSDCVVDKNYFRAFDSHFNNAKNRAFTLNFRHVFDQKTEADIKIIDAGKKYETYLRYFRLALKFTGYPTAIHTIGSCFATTAEAYIKVGGMPRLQAGEDFYYLHKLSQAVEIVEVKEKMVFPSYRLSERVPFGTGRAVAEILKKDEYEVYCFAAFCIIKTFFEQFASLYSQDIDIQNIPLDIINCFGEEKLKNDILELRANSSSEKTFVKRAFSKFDAFWIIKLLNSLKTTKQYQNTDIQTSASNLLSAYNIEHTDDFADIYKKIDKLDQTV